MKYKKIALLSLISLTLMGCTSSNKPTVKKIEPVPTKEELTRMIPDKTYKILKDVYGQDITPAMNMLKIAGKEIKDLTMDTITVKKDKDFLISDGKSLNFNKLKGKKYVVEIVADWCEYCNQMQKNYFKDIKKENDDIVFVQLFAQGDKKAIQEFYKKSGVEADIDYVLPEQAATNDILQNFNVSSFPTFLFFDEKGKLSWEHTGMIDSEAFKALKSKAYGTVKIYDTFKEGEIDFDKINRSYDDVFADLSDEAIKLIKTIIPDEDKQMALYANLNKNFIDVSLTDADGKKVKLGDFKGKEFVFEILNVDEENYPGSLTSVKNLNKFKEKYKDVVYLQFWLPTENKSAKQYMEAAGLKSKADYVFEFNAENNVPELGDLEIYNFPTQIFINKDFKVAGVMQGAITEEQFDKAFDVFFKNTLYEMKK